MDFKGIAKTIMRGAAKHSPAIFTGLGIFGFGTTVVMVAKASPKAKVIHDDESLFREHVPDDKEEMKDSYIREAKQLLPLYGPPAAMGLLSIGCFVYANKIHMNNQAAIMAAYSLSEKTLATYQEKVIEKLGEEAHADILKETSKAIVESTPSESADPKMEVIPMGKIKVYDFFTSRYFFSTKEDIFAAVAAVNELLLDQVIVPHREFYYALGLYENYALADAAGWDSSQSEDWKRKLSVNLVPHMDSEQNPCIALHYHAMLMDRTA